MAQDGKPTTKISLRNQGNKHARFVYRELEPRIAFDAALLATATDIFDDDLISSSNHSDIITSSNSISDAAEDTPVTASLDEPEEEDRLLQALAGIGQSGQSSHEVMFVDGDVADIDTLLTGLDPSIEIVMLDEAEDGIFQMAAYLEGRSGIDAIHIISHGSQAELALGNASLTLESMSSVHADALDRIGASLSENADLLIYGCSFGEGVAGQQATLQLAMLTGADIAASDDLTGHEAEGGDWQLEVTTGEIESDLAIGHTQRISWAHTLPAPTDILRLPGIAASEIQGVYGFNVTSDLTQDDHGAEDLSLSGSPTQVTGDDGTGALDLSGGQYAELPSFTSGGAMTIAASVRFDSTDSWQRVFDFGQTDSGGIGNIYVGRFGTSSDLTFTLEESGNFTNRATAVGAITDGAWLHFVATIDADGTGTFYVNGSQVASFSGNAMQTGVRDNYFIGRSHHAVDAAFDGAIDNFIVLNTHVNGDQASAIYSQSDAFTISEASADGSVVGTVIGLDSDAGENLTFSLTDDAEGRFSIDSSTGEITVSDTSLLDYETNISHNVTIRVSDSLAQTYDEVAAVSVSDVPGDAGATVPGSQIVDEDGTLTFSSGGGNAITITDDTGSDTVMRVTLTTTNGTLALSQLTGISFVDGYDHSGYMVLEGLESDLNAALEGMIFSADAGYVGAANVAVTASNTAGLVGRYTFDDGDGGDSSIGVLQDGTLMGDAAVISDADRGQVLDLSGAGEVIADGLAGEPSDITLAAWVNLTSADTNGAEVISLGDSAFIRLDESGNLTAAYYDGTTWRYASNAATLAGTGWHHVALTLDDSTHEITLYLDGASVASTTGTTSVVYGLGSDIHIGSHGQGYGTYDFNGQIDDARIYTQALSAAQIAALAANGDETTVNVSLTVQGVNDAPTFELGSGFNDESLATLYDSVVDLVILPDGGFITLSGVNTASSGQDLDFGLTRYNADGTVDTSWGTNGVVITAVNGNNETATSITLQADGKIVVAGAYSTGATSDGIVIRYNADGSLDTSFSSDGMAEIQFASGANDFIRDVVIQQDGSIVVVGEAYVSGYYELVAARLTSSGTPDTSFGSGGKVFVNFNGGSEYGRAVLLQSDGRIVIGGYVAGASSDDMVIVRLNTDGSLDTSFDTDGIWTNYPDTGTQRGTCIALDASDRILIAGTTDSAGSTDSFVMRVNSDGTTDNSFGSSGRVTITAGSPYEQITSIQVLDNGQILIAGSAYNGSNNDVLITRLNSDGSLDTSFGTSGHVIEDFSGATDQVEAMAIDGDGNIIVAGRYDADGFIASFDSEGNLNTRFNGTTTLDGTPTFTEDGSAVVLDSDVEIYDVELSAADNFDGASIQIVRDGGFNADDIFEASGMLSSLTQGGTFSVGGTVIGTVTTNSAGLLVLTFNSNATNALVNSALQQIAYRNSSNNPPASVNLNWTFSDGNSGAQGSGGVQTAVGTTTVAVTAINDAPVNSVPGTQTTDPNTPITLSSANGTAISISDLDADSGLMEITLTITNGTVSLFGVSGLSFTVGDGVSDSAMTFTGTIADINTALDGLIFTPATSFEGTASISITTNDQGNAGSGGAQSDTDVVTIHVGGVTFQQGLNGYTGTEDTYTSSTWPTSVNGNSQLVSADDGLPSETGLLQFTNLFGSSGGQIPLGSTINSVSIWIYVVNTDLFDSINVHQMLTSWNESSNHNSLGNGVQIDDSEASSTVLHSIDAGQGGWVEISGITALVQSWANGDANNGLAFVSNAADNWEFASSEYSNTNLRPYIAIDYTAPVAPVITPTGGSATFTEGAGAVLIDAGITLSDSDSSDLTGVTIQITNYVNGEDSLFFVNQNGISGSWDSGTGTLTLSGTASVADYQAALRSITYENGSNDPDTTTRTIEIVASDPFSDSNTASVSITIDAVNDDPSNGGSLPTDITVTEGSSGTVDLSSIVLADPDAGNGLLELVLRSSSGGLFTCASGTGITITYNGTDDVVLTGTLANLNSYLSNASNISYSHPNSNLNGNNADSFEVLVRDMGNSGSGGGSFVSLGTVSVDITASNDLPSGAPTITGTATENETLIADTSSISDPDGLGSFGYQWLRNGIAISGATGSTYTLVDADVGHQISVRITYTDGDGFLETLTSSQTSAVVNANDAPTGLPVISGTPSEDQTLTADTSGIADEDGLGSFSYQWLRNGIAISGASGSSYVLTQADVGTQISVRISYSDARGTSESLTSAQTSVVTNVNDAPSGLPTISGSTIETQTLTADTSGISDEDGLGSFSYQWLRDGIAIGGATGGSYILTADDIGTQISVRVIYTDGYGASETVTSAQTSAITSNQAPIVDINGAASGIDFSATYTEDDAAVDIVDGSSTISDADHTSYLDLSINITNMRDGANEEVSIAGHTFRMGISETQALTVGATTFEIDFDGSGFTITRDGGGFMPEADLQTLLRGITYRNISDAPTEGDRTIEIFASDAGGGNGASAYSTITVEGRNDAPTGLPTISGSATEHQTLIADTSAIADADGLGTFSYQWLRDGVAISGASGSSYMLDDGDVGAQISVQITYTDAQGTTETLTSLETGVVTGVNDDPVGLPTISGLVEENQTLTADISGIADDDGLGNFSYQWLRDGAAISGASGATYILGDADVGARIAVRVIYIDGGGTLETLSSTETAAVANVNDAPTGSVVIEGPPSIGSQLIVDTGSIGDLDGVGTLTYQWTRDGNVIAGATSATYLVTLSDAGDTISVTVSFVDGGGSSEQLSARGVEIEIPDEDSDILEFLSPLPDPNQPLDEDLLEEELDIELEEEDQRETSGGIQVGTPNESAAEGASTAKQQPDAEGSEASVFVEYEDSLDADEKRYDMPGFKELSRALSARVQYERLGFGQVDTQVTYQAIDQSIDDIQRGGQLFGASKVDLTLSVGSVLSAGFVTWVLRSGALMSALVSTMPVWRGFDPLLVLGSTTPLAIANTPKKAEESEELSSAERVFDNAAKIQKEHEKA